MGLMVLRNFLVSWVEVDFCAEMSSNATFMVTNICLNCCVGVVSVFLIGDTTCVVGVPDWSSSKFKIVLSSFFV